MSRPSRLELLAHTPVKTAVMAFALPTIISQLINVVYNLADIFFVGQIGDPNKVAAVSLSFPAFMIATALGNLFGIGGGAAMSRAIGKGDMELAKKHTTFCFYGSIAAAGLYSLALLFLIRPFLRVYGASSATLPYAAQYVFWVLTIGAIPTVLNVVMAHLIRADGKPRIASIGMSAGGILNTILDPVFVLGLKMEVTGVAVATLISNTLVCLFFLAYWAKHRSELVTVLSPKNLSLKKEVYAPVMASGVPAAVQTFVVGLFFMFINRQARNYSDIHVAAIGIVQKLDLIAQNVTLGLAQGIIPLLGYSYAAGDYDRMNRVAKFSLLLGVSFACLYVAVCEVFAPTLVAWFIPDSPQTIALGTYCARVMCVCTPFMAICNILNATFQATGQTKDALNVALFRKAYFGLPVLYLLDYLFPVLGLLLVLTVVDSIASVYVFYLYRKFRRRITREKLADAV